MADQIQRGLDTKAHIDTNPYPHLSASLSANRLQAASGHRARAELTHPKSLDSCRAPPTDAESHANATARRWSRQTGPRSSTVWGTAMFKVGNEPPWRGTGEIIVSKQALQKEKTTKLPLRSNGRVRRMASIATLPSPYTPRSGAIVALRSGRKGLATFLQAAHVSLVFLNMVIINLGLVRKFDSWTTILRQDWFPVRENRFLWHDAWRCKQSKKAESP